MDLAEQTPYRSTTRPVTAGTHDRNQVEGRSLGVPALNLEQGMDAWLK